MIASILLFDRSAILSSDAHFWRAVSSIGTCMIPQAVVEEINSIISGFGADNNQVLSASEFQRFLKQSNWQVTDISGSDPTLTQKLSNSVSRGSRLDLAIAECGYGLALTSTTDVILVTNTPLLLQAVNALNQDKLTAVTLANVRPWVQNRQIPSQKLINPTITSRAVTVRNANNARINKFVVTIFSWIVIGAIGLVAWRSLQPKEFKQFWQKTGLPNFIK